MSPHECTVDCGIEATPTWVDQSAQRPTCVGTDRIREIEQVFGEYPLGGDFSKFGYDLVIDQDMEVNQRVLIPAEQTWRACRDLIINAGGVLIVDGFLILGED